jgi:anti-sigma B factor antagonist
MEIVTTLKPNGVAILQPAGRIDAQSALAFKERIGEVIDSGHPWLVLDLSAVTFLDSTGLGALVNSMKRAAASGGDLRLAHVPQAVRMTIELTSMQLRLPRYATIADALLSYP